MPLLDTIKAIDSEEKAVEFVKQNWLEALPAEAKNDPNVSKSWNEMMILSVIILRFVASAPPSVAVALISAGTGITIRGLLPWNSTPQEAVPALLSSAVYVPLLSVRVTVVSVMSCTCYSAFSIQSQ